MDYNQVVGISAGICTSVSMFPQLVKLIKTKRAEDLSLFYLIILFIGLALWIWYGILQADIPIIATNALSIVLNACVMVLGIHYKKKST